MRSLKIGHPYVGAPGTWKSPSSSSSRYDDINLDQMHNGDYDEHVDGIEFDVGKDFSSADNHFKNSDLDRNDGQNWNQTSFQEVFRFNSADSRDASGSASSVGRFPTYRNVSSW